MIGQEVMIDVEGYGVMRGTVERIVKVTVPFGPESLNPEDWTYHVKVDSRDPRRSGTFQVKRHNMAIKE